MPVEGLEYFICILEKDSVHLSLVNRLPSQIVIKSYQNFKFDSTLPKYLSNAANLEEITNYIKSKAPLDRDPGVIVSFPTTYGYIDEFKSVAGLSHNEINMTGELLLETATRQNKEILNFQILDKNKSGKWIFAIAKRFTKPIVDVFSSNSIKTQGIILNAVSNANFIEGKVAAGTTVFIESTDAFFEAWFLNRERQISEWRLINKNADIISGNPSSSNTLIQFIQQYSKEYQTSVEHLFYTGIKENNEIKQLFSNDNTYNLLEADISEICTLSPEVAEKFGFKGNESFLVKIAGTALS